MLVSRIQSSGVQGKLRQQPARSSVTVTNAIRRSRRGGTEADEAPVVETAAVTTSSSSKPERTPEQRVGLSRASLRVHASALYQLIYVNTAAAAGLLSMSSAAM